MAGRSARGGASGHQDDVVDWVEEGAFFFVPTPRAVGYATREQEEAASAAILAAIREERPELTMIEFRAPFEPDFYDILPPEVWNERFVVMFVPPYFMPPVSEYPVIFGVDELSG